MNSLDLNLNVDDDDDDKKVRKYRLRGISALSAKFKEIPMYQKAPDILAKNVEISIYNETLRQLSYSYSYSSLLSSSSSTFKFNNDNNDNNDNNRRVNFDFKLYHKIFHKTMFYLTSSDQFSQLIQEKIRNKELKILEVAGKSERELDFGDTYEKARKKLDLIYVRGQQTESMKKLQNEHIGLFTCKRCKSHRTTYTQQQTRSADEPMTVMVVCSQCNFKYKFC